MLSLTRFRGRYLIYARANMQSKRGGRYVQVAMTDGDDPRGPYGAFSLLTIAGYEASVASGNIYFAAVKPNPLDRGTLLGLFPVVLKEALPQGTGGANNDTGIIGLSISCDGRHWAPLVVLTTCYARRNRTKDQPADGFIVRGSTIFVLIHRNVPGVTSVREREVVLQPLALNRSLLVNLTRAAHETLPGCGSSRPDDGGAKRPPAGPTARAHPAVAQGSESMCEEVGDEPVPNLANRRSSTGLRKGRAGRVRGSAHAIPGSTRSSAPLTDIYERAWRVMVKMADLAMATLSLPMPRFFE
mmetsp:Transcript_23640/g.69402  ORF Transcript_23640/g.69402 Transcript_23640/m.69402 type:complete len:300 (+) Transcript_23640:1014-1913(+)